MRYIAFVRREMKMADNTLDKIIREVSSLSPEQQQRLIELLAERIPPTSQKNDD